MALIQKRFYLPEQLYTSLATYARKKKKTITYVVRVLLEKGIQVDSKVENTALTSLKLAQQLNKKEKKGKEDFAARHNDHFKEAYDNNNS